MDATLPEIDLHSLIPQIFSLVPMNGQIRINDQVFNIGLNETLTTPQTPINNTNDSFSREVPSFDSSIPTVESHSPNFDSRVPNFRPQIPNFNSRIPNFRPRIPNFDSRIPNFESRIPNFNLAPNPIQTQSSTLTNANRFNEPVLRSTLPTPTMDTMPFGFPIPMRARSNVNPSEMSLIVAQDKIVRTEGSSMNAPPVSIPLQMPKMTDNERNALMSSTPVLTPPQEPQMNERREETPIFIDEGSPDSMQVTRQISFAFPPATINQIPVETAIGEPNARSALEQRLQTLIAEPQAFNSSFSHFENSVIPIKFMPSLFRPQRIPTLQELDKITAKRIQSLEPINKMSTFSLH